MLLVSGKCYSDARHRQTLNIMLFLVALLQISNAAEIFEDGRRFRRTKANSPVYLQKSTVTVKNVNPRDNSIIEMERPGFLIKTLNHETVGYVTLGDFSWMIPDALSISWLAIMEGHRRKGYATQVVLTIEGVAKAHQPDVRCIHVATGEDNEAMIALLGKIGYTRVRSQMTRMADFVKNIARVDNHANQMTETAQ